MVFRKIHTKFEKYKKYINYHYFSYKKFEIYKRNLSFPSLTSFLLIFYHGNDFLVIITDSQTINKNLFGKQ